MKRVVCFIVGISDAIDDALNRFYSLGVCHDGLAITKKVIEMALFKYYAGAIVADPLTFNQTTGLYRVNSSSTGRLGILKQDIPYALNQEEYSKAIMDVGQISGYPQQKTIIGASSTSGADQILGLIDNGYADFYFDEPGNPGHDSLDYVNTMLPIIHAAGGRVWIGDCIQCLDGHTPHWGFFRMLTTYYAITTKTCASTQMRAWVNRQQVIVQLCRISIITSKVSSAPSSLGRSSAPIRLFGATLILFMTG